MYHEEAAILFPEIFLQARHAIPNLMIRMHEAPDTYLDRRFFLPLTIAARYFWTRHVALLGDNPVSHSHFSEALNLWKGSVENLSVWIRPGQINNRSEILSACANEIVYQLGPYQSSNQWDADAIMFKEEIAKIKTISSRVRIRAVFYFSAFALSTLREIIQKAEEARLDKLEFFPPQLIHDNEYSNKYNIITTNELLSNAQLSEFESGFWEIMDDKYFQSCMFDLDMTRRQFERIILFYKAALGNGGFAPPHCRASRTALFIEPNGAVRCCPFQTVLGNLWEKPLRDIEENPSTHDFRTKINLYSDKLCTVCPGDYPHSLWRAH